MKKLLIICTFALLASGAQAQERQEGGRRDFGGNRKEMTAQMAEQTAKKLKLDKETKAWFIPIFTEYQDSTFALRGHGRNANREKKEMTNEEALEALNKEFAREEQLLALKRDYCTRLAEKLTPQQLYTIFAERGMRGQRRQQNQDNNDSNGFPPPPGGFGGFGPGF